MSNLIAKLAEVRKAIVGLAGILAALLAQGVVPSPYDGYVSAVLAVLATLGVYQVRNAEPLQGVIQAGSEGDEAGKGVPAV